MIPWPEILIIVGHVLQELAKTLRRQDGTRPSANRVKEDQRPSAHPSPDD